MFHCHPPCYKQLRDKIVQSCKSTKKSHLVKLSNEQRRGASSLIQTTNQRLGLPLFSAVAKYLIGCNLNVERVVQLSLLEIGSNTAGNSWPQVAPRRREQVGADYSVPLWTETWLTGNTVVGWPFSSFFNSAQEPSASHTQLRSSRFCQFP